MLEWILATLGVGGIAAAIVFVPGAKAIAMQFVGFVAELVRRYPVWCLLALALGLAWWQRSERIDMREQRDKARATLVVENSVHASDIREWMARTAAATAARIEAERKSKETANDAQAQYDALLADNDGLRDYIARNRLRDERRQEPALPSTGADEDHTAGVPADAAPGALVAVSEDDLGRCDAGYSYAAAAHQWVQGLIDKGLAETAP